MEKRTSFQTWCSQQKDIEHFENWNKLLSKDVEDLKEELKELRTSKDKLIKKWTNECYRLKKK